MKRILICWAALSLVILIGMSGCLQKETNSRNWLVEGTLTDSFSFYREQVRMGDMSAYLKLADL